MPTLYVTEQGARLEKEYGRILVVKEDAPLLAVPFARVDQVVLVGRVGVTTPLLHELLDKGVTLSLLNRWGKLRGRLMPPAPKNLPLRIQQIACAGDGAFCLALSRELVRGKITNARTYARRLARNQDMKADICFTRMNDTLKALPDAADPDRLRGLEGAASRAYFGVLRRALDPEWRFPRRTRRPPTDPVNALLSLGYTLLAENVAAACEVVGLDPYVGFFHTNKYGRPALALDLMEEFRSVIVDSLVYSLISRGRFQPDDFRPGPNGGVYLRGPGLKRFFNAYADTLQREVKVKEVGRRLSYQKILEVQARKVRKIIEGGGVYMPYLTR
ncbi:MAG: CRISPR-associated endonuclease Cas1 [Caldilineaceae bacterium]|nr:CRISPR-associated endonuclease Cas1 [Caldilineaceae bacterium]